MNITTKEEALGFIKISIKDDVSLADIYQSLQIIEEYGYNRALDMIVRYCRDHKSYTVKREGDV